MVVLNQTFALLKDEDPHGLRAYPIGFGGL
jgi:hypothetical protein